MRILVIGEAGHGKTTVADMIAAELNAKRYSTSQVLVHALAGKHGVSEQTILKHKEKFRPELIALGNALCDACPSTLTNVCLFASKSSGFDNVVIDGVRRRSEFKAVDPLFDYIIYVFRPGVLIKDNFELHEVLANIDTSNLKNRYLLFINDLPLHELKDKVNSDVVSSILSEY